MPRIVDFLQLFVVFLKKSSKPRALLFFMRSPWESCISKQSATLYLKGRWCALTKVYIEIFGIYLYIICRTLKKVK